ncbi:MAG: thioredoxin [Phycisphaerales bacterium]|nr:thioredoxin [Phycisphaerales bacterium]
MAGPNTLTINEANFQSEVLQSSVPVLIDFWAPWCQPCLKLAPTIDELANDFAGRAKVAKLDIDSAMELALKFDINTIPTVLIMKGGQTIARFGASPKAVYAEALEKALKA